MGHNGMPQANRNQTDQSPRPAAMRIWNNKARLSLRGPILIWLALLVGVQLASLFFVREYWPARWVIGGFIASHVVVVLLGKYSPCRLRACIVSLTHVLCWSPGWFLSQLTWSDYTSQLAYTIWVSLYVIVVAASFYFDLRDASIYLRTVYQSKKQPQLSRFLQ